MCGKCFDKRAERLFLKSGGERAKRIVVCGHLSSQIRKNVKLIMVRFDYMADEGKGAYIFVGKSKAS